MNLNGGLTIGHTDAKINGTLEFTFMNMIIDPSIDLYKLKSISVAERKLKLLRKKI